MLLKDSRLGQGCISLHNNKCRNDFDCPQPVNLSMYFRQVTNSVNVCF